MIAYKNTNRSDRCYKFIVWIWIVFCLCAANIASADRMLVQAGSLKLVLERTQQGICILSLFDNTTGHELLALDTPPLFGLELRHVKTKDLATLAADSGWREVKVLNVDAAGRHVLFFEEPAHDSLKGISVEVKVQTDDNESALF